MKYKLERGLVDDKTLKIGLGANVTMRNDEFVFVVVEDPKDPIWSTYACLNRLLKHLPSTWQQHIFVSKAPQKVLKIRRRNNDFSEAWWDLVDDKKGGMKPAGKLGKNKPTILFRELAERCGFNNPQRFTSRAARRTGISKMGKAGVNQHIINQKARHADTSTNKLYNDPHETSLADAAVALHYQGNDDGPFSTFDDEKENLVPHKSGFEGLVPEDSYNCTAQKPASVLTQESFQIPVAAQTTVPTPAQSSFTPAPPSSYPFVTPAGVPYWYMNVPPPTVGTCISSAPPPPQFQSAPPATVPPPAMPYHHFAPPAPQYAPAPPVPGYGYQYAAAPAAPPAFSYGYTAGAAVTPYLPTPTYHPVPAPPAPPHGYQHSFPAGLATNYAPQHNLAPWLASSGDPSNPPQASHPHHQMYFHHPPQGN
jgi:hypothetical protein